jgi:hypothetical protein
MISNHEIKRLVDEWNPIGTEGLPDDEYDCLVNKIKDWLEEDADKDELICLLEEDLQDHFCLNIDQESIIDFVDLLLEEVNDTLEHFVAEIEEDDE